EAQTRFLLVVVVARGPVGIIGAGVRAAIRVARIVGIVAVGLLETGNIVVDSRRSGARDQRRDVVLLAGRERSRHAAGGRQFVLREDPVGVFVELPVRVAIALLHAVVGAHAERQPDEIGLLVG